MPIEPVVQTTAGAVRGVISSGVAKFLGVPYAAPPVGANRFKAPQPCAAWRGVRDATLRGANAPQFTRPFPSLDVEPLVKSGWTGGDDFLTANIWAPSASGAGRPVMVFIHGGAFVLGSNDAAVQDGSRFAESGVVCVAINYRLGVEGFLPIPGAATNLGLRDQIAALHWVRDNIAVFGGDPDNITVFGESAGAMSLGCLLASPLAAGLFKRAILQSGHGSMVRAIPLAQRAVGKVASFLKVTPDLDGFRSTTLPDCIAAAERLTRPQTRLDLRNVDGREPTFGMGRFAPVYGDDVLPDHPLKALELGWGSDVDLLIGTNTDEMNLYFVPTGVVSKLPGWMAWLALRRSEPDARAILKAYAGQAKDRRPGAVLSAAMTDLVFRLPARRFAEAHRGRTHLYSFGWRSPACEGQLGAAHGVELPFVFNNLPACTGPNGLLGTDPPQDLADHIHRIWVAYGASGHLPWPEYSGTEPRVMKLESESTAFGSPALLDELHPLARRRG